jgi:magnesium transporter
MAGMSDTTAAVTPKVEPRGVCVAVLPNEKPVRIYAESPAEFIDTLNKSTIAWVNFAVDDLHRDGEMVATILGFSGSLVESLLAGPYSNYDDRETELGIRLPVVKLKGVELEVEPLLLLVRDDLVLSLHEAGKVTRMGKFARYADSFMRKIPNDLAFNDKITMILIRLISQNNDRNFEGLRQIQETGDQIGALLAKQELKGDRRVLGSRIYEMKHTLVAYLDTLWASLDVIQSLRYGDAELISDDATYLARVGILADDVNRQIQLSEHMSQVLISGLEVLQSMYNNELQQLNNRLAGSVAWLTILGTAILVPNTIATILGANLVEFGVGFWEYVAFIVLATLFSVWISVRYVRSRGLLKTQ